MTNHKSLTVLRNLELTPLYYTMTHIEEEGRERFLGELYAVGGEQDLAGYLGDMIIKDVNPFSLACAKGETPSEYVLKAFCEDVETVRTYVDAVRDNEKFRAGTWSPLLTDTNKKIGDITAFYRTHGYGIFIDNMAFRYEDGKLEPLKDTVKTRLTDLKGYEEEKEAVVFNIRNFLSGAPWQDTLLYGDRGTGKSSTVQAVLNEFSDQGLRLIQADKSQIGRIDEIRRLVAGNPLKFIIFFDDITLASDSPDLSSFKAALEGSMMGSENCMIVATSNRRHIIQENFSDRDNDVHPGEREQDIISLSDRFGLTVYFSSTGKAEYLKIVDMIAADLGLTTENLPVLAERWAMYRGGRSPRSAKQFCLFAKSCEMAGKPVEI